MDLYISFKHLPSLSFPSPSEHTTRLWILSGHSLLLTQIRFHLSLRPFLHLKLPVVYTFVSYPVYCHCISLSLHKITFFNEDWLKAFVHYSNLHYFANLSLCFHFDASSLLFKKIYSFGLFVLLLIIPLSIFLSPSLQILRSISSFSFRICCYGFFTNFSMLHPFLFMLSHTFCWNKKNSWSTPCLNWVNTRLDKYPISSMSLSLNSLLSACSKNSLINSIFSLWPFFLTFLH